MAASAHSDPIADDAVTIAALGMLAYMASMMMHEAIGHGAACVALRGQNTMLTGWAESCDLDPLPLLVPAAGPVVQFFSGLLAWAALRRLAPERAPVVYAFLWLYMVFSLFISSGYVAFSGVTGFGDAAVLVATLEPTWLWRVLLFIVGALAYYGSMRAANCELGGMLGSGGRQRLWRFLWGPYVAAGTLACVAGAFNHTMDPGAALRLAALSSFAAASGLPSLTQLPREVPRPDLVDFRVRRSPAWISAAVLAGAAFLYLIGPGLGGL